MRVVFSLLFTVAVILDAIEISSGTEPITRNFLANFGIDTEHADQQGSSSQSDVNAHTQGFPGSSSGRQRSSERASSVGPLQLGQPSSSRGLIPQSNVSVHTRGSPSSHSPARQQSPEWSPEGRPPSFEVFGYSLDKLGYFRLIPRTNLKIIFQFQRYVIPASKPITVRAGGRYVPVPRRKYIVLSATNGDVYALVEYSGIFRAIYGTNEDHHRVKVNMRNGRVHTMTPDEERYCPIDEYHAQFPDTFIQTIATTSTLEPEWLPAIQPPAVGPSSSAMQNPHDLTPREDRRVRSRSRSSQRDHPIRKD